MSAIETIGRALRYDAVETLLIRGSLADAMALAARIAESLPVGDDSAPESRATVATETLPA
jgi:hypothetical protein